MIVIIFHIQILREEKYKFISFFYDLIDVFYFNRKEHSPRTVILNFLPDTQINLLDVCAGTGTNSLLIAKNKLNANITAIDLSKDMLNIANKKFIKANIKNADTIVMDATKTDFCNHYFDIVLISLVLHEVNEDLRQGIIREAKRIMKNDGRIIVVEWEQPKTVFRRLMFKFIKTLEPKGFKDFLKSDLIRFSNHYGLEVNSIVKCDYSKVLELSKQR